MDFSRQAIDQRLRQRRERDLEGALDDREEALVLGKPVPRRSLVHHLVEDAAKRPDVRRPADLRFIRLGKAHADAVVAGISRLEEHFRRDVGERAHEAVAEHAGGFGRHGLGDSEVDELELALDEEEIAGLEVAVDDVLVVDRVHGGEHLLPHQADEVHVERFVGLAGASEVGFQVGFAAFEELGVRRERERDDVEDVVGFVEFAVDQLDDAGSATQRLQKGHFVEEIIVVDLIGRIGAQLHTL